MNAGQTNAAILKMSFWEAVKRCVIDPDVAMGMNVDADGPGLVFDGGIPEELWGHMADVVVELRAAAGL